jgi:hypothetical protein
MATTTDTLSLIDKMSPDKMSVDDKRGPQMSPEPSLTEKPKEKNKPAPNRDATKRPTPFLDGFQLDAELMSFANERGIDPQEEFQAFREHHKSKGSLFVDWRAAWRTWVLNGLKFNRSSHSSGRQKGTAHGRSTRPSGALDSGRQFSHQPDATLSLS